MSQRSKWLQPQRPAWRLNHGVADRSVHAADNGRGGRRSVCAAGSLLPAARNAALGGFFITHWMASDANGDQPVTAAAFTDGFGVDDVRI